MDMCIGGDLMGLLIKKDVLPEVRSGVAAAAALQLVWVGPYRDRHIALGSSPWLHLCLSFARLLPCAAGLGEILRR
jgi:hypothetical protein